MGKVSILLFFASIGLLALAVLQQVVAWVMDDARFLFAFVHVFASSAVLMLSSMAVGVTCRSRAVSMREL